MRIFSLKEICLVIVGLGMLGIIIFSFTDPHKNPLGIGSDSYEFWHLSTNLLEKHTFTYTDLKYYPLFFLGDRPPSELTNLSVPCTARVPGYPALLAIARSIWNSPYMAIGLNMLSYIGICLYGFLLGRLLLPSEKLRLLYNILLAFSPLYFIRWGVGADYCASFYLTGFVFHLIKTTQVEFKSRPHIVAAALLGNLAILTRPNLLIFIFSLTFLMFIPLLNKHPYRLFRLFMITLLLLLGINIWIERNKNLTGQRTLSTQGGSVLYTVHLAPHVNETHPLYSWSKYQRLPLFIEHLRSGKTFNQSEVIINDQTINVSIQFLKQNPSLLIKNTIDCLRTMFLFSYYDIADILIYTQRPITDRLQYLETEHYDPINSTENFLRQSLFQLSRLYKICLAFGFFALPFLLLVKKIRNCLPHLSIFIALYITTWLSVCSTAFFTGAGGDRLRMPFNACIVLFAIFFWFHVIKLITHANRKSL